MSDGNTKTTLDDARGLRVGRILNNFLDARARGEAVNEVELLTKHPDLADELRQHLELLGELRPATDKIEALIAQGILSPCNAEEGGDRLRAKVSGTDSPRGACPRFPPRYLAQLGPYKIFGILGSGGMGFVLKAYEESLNRVVALKILRPELAGDKAALARFTREAKAAAALKHPNIVTVYAVGQERDTHYLAMEYVEGPNLANVIRDPNVAAGAPAGRGSIAPDTSSAETDRALSASEGNTTPTPQIPNRESPIANPELVRHIFRQLLSALAAAHEAGLIHRDVKSSNILLDCGSEIGDWGLKPADRDTDNPSQSPIPNRQSPIVKLADFGLARMITVQTRVTLGDSILGTPEYMSPEQARGDENIDHRSDLYSAGVVLYEMLTGRTPFKADTPTAVIHQILHTDPPDPCTLAKGVDPKLASLALRLMAKSPEDRFISASDAIAVLEVDKAVRSPERRRRLRGRLVASIAAVGLLLGVSWVAWELAPRRPAITDVRIDPDTGRGVQIRYGTDAEWTVFCRFGEDVGLTDATVVDVDGRGRQIVVAGSKTPLDDASNVLAAFDHSGKEVWRIPLHSELHWPDCEEPRAWWCVSHVVSGELDGAPGEELVVVGQDLSEYPTRVSVVDPRSGEIRSSFWHFGHIMEIRLLPAYFEDGRPAILALGLSNELDGFKDGLRDAEMQFAHWDCVNVVMILDPLDMDGLSPPRPHPSRKLNIPTARVCAYAFLDRPYNPTVRHVPERYSRQEPAPTQGLTPDQMMGIHSTQDAQYRAKDGSGPWLEIYSGAKAEDGNPIGPVTVDRNLQPRRYGPTHPPGHVTASTKDYWDRYWHPIIQNGEPVGKYAGE